MHRLLDDAGPEHAGDVPQFLTELPEIRSRQLAFNRGVTIADAYVVATPLLARDGRLIAAALLRLVRGGQTPRRGGPVQIATASSVKIASSRQLGSASCPSS
jgi:DNA-binding IclR family transcriptional regulator